MTTHRREKFTTRGDSEILAAVRRLARSEGRQLQSLVDEALADLIEKRRGSRSCARVMAVYQASHERYAPLYRKLAE